MEAMGWLAYAATAVDNYLGIDGAFASVLDNRSGVDLATQPASSRTTNGLIATSTG
jgi:hypothetical protein